MLEGMRRATQNWFGRTILTIVFGFLIFSFAIWGIGDIFRGIGVSNVAEVGSTNISTQDYRQAYQTQLQNLQRQMRRAVTNEQARAFGIDRQVLQRMISEAALDHKVKQLGLAISDETIARLILEDPMFQGFDGRFDRMRFNDIMRENGFNELSFVREQRRTHLRREIAEAVAGNVPVPLAVQEAIHQYSSETRAIEFIILPATFAGEVPAPTLEQLQAYFEPRRSSWRMPEYRKIVTLAITPQLLADPAQVSETDARAHYERIKGDRFGTPETRALQQIVFSSEEAAQNASNKIKGGATFAEIAKEQNLSDADIALGTVTRASMVDTALAEAAFALSEGSVSAPVRGRFGWVLLRADKINLANVREFAEVADEVKRELAMSRARPRVQQLHDAIEDERTSGKALVEAAKKAGFDVVTIEAVDQQGRDPAGNPVVLTDRDSVLRAIFASDIGVDNEAVNTRDGGYVWFEIVSIDPAHERKLDEVKDEIVAAWREDETRRLLSAKAAELVKAMEDGASIADIAKNNGGLEVQVNGSVRRGGAEGLPPGVVAQVFNAPVGKAGSAAGAELTRYVFKINDSVVPPFEADSDQSRAVAAQLAQAFSGDLLEQYLSKLQADIGVKINAAALNLAVGGGESF